MLHLETGWWLQCFFLASSRTDGDSHYLSQNSLIQYQHTQVHKTNEWGVLIRFPQPHLEIFISRIHQHLVLISRYDPANGSNKKCLFKETCCRVANSLLVHTYQKGAWQRKISVGHVSLKSHLHWILVLSWNENKKQSSIWCDWVSKSWPVLQVAGKVSNPLLWFSAHPVQS